MINYQVDSKQIFRVVFTGTIQFDEIISYLNDFKEIKDLLRKLNLLYDLTNAEVV